MPPESQVSLWDISKIGETVDRAFEGHHAALRASNTSFASLPSIGWMMRASRPSARSRPASFRAASIPTGSASAQRPRSCANRPRAPGTRKWAFIRPNFGRKAHLVNSWAQRSWQFATTLTGMRDPLDRRSVKSSPLRRRTPPGLLPAREMARTHTFAVTGPSRRAAIELPHHQRVALAHVLERCLEGRPLRWAPEAFSSNTLLQPAVFKASSCRAKS